MNENIEYLLTSRITIENHMRSWFVEQQKLFPADLPWITDSYERLIEFAVKGKMIRGSLFLLTCELFGEELDSSHYNIAVGLELFHSALLIHDDIMDNDYIRRGSKTLFAQYEEVAKKHTQRDARHFGDSMAICLGDNSLFLAFSAIGATKFSETIKMELLQYFAKEAQIVGFGQMQDVFLTNILTEPDEKDIFSVYRYKTARYTFSLPMGLGAIVSGKQKKVRDELELLGENIGLIFQIRDDELRYFYIEEIIGKTVGSDIREDTKTIFRYYLFQRATNEELKKLNNIFGNPDAEKADFIYVYELMKQKNIFEDIKKKVDTYHANASKLINDLDSNSDYKKILHSLVQYVYQRTK